ncbi:MAG: LVIVD repeat-containing protein [Ignavibacteria bacterium]
MFLKKFSSEPIILSILFISFITTGCKESTTETPQTSSRMSLVSARDLPGYSYGIYVTNVGATNYAFIAAGSGGLQIVNVSAPILPIIAGSASTSGEAYDVFVETVNGIPYAFVSDGPMGFDIFDVSNVSSPVLDTIISFPNDRVLTSYIDSSSRIAYVGTFNGKVAIWDISNLPNSVAQIAVYITVNNINGIFVDPVEDFCYLAEGTSGLEIINVANPSNPTYAGSVNTPGISYYVTVGGNYAYIADGGAGITVVDVSNPLQPEFRRSVTTLGDALGVFYTPNPSQLYTAEGGSGCETFGAGDPTNPVQLGFYNTNGHATNVFYYVGYIFLADGPDGLVILRYSQF